MAYRDSNITFSLDTGRGRYEHHDLSRALFADYINQLSPDFWDFLILEPSLPIQGTTFIQVAAPTTNTDSQLTMEIGLYNPRRIEIYRYYSADRNELFHILADYFENQEIPDYRYWEDVSDELNAL